ncbi:MAG: site-specific integrase [Alphaproteobacteria bacterium]|nr:site-specific integrase [Alphaproteobacteria bacterium]
MCNKHTLMGGKLNLYKRNRSSYWQCGAFIAGKYRRKSTKEESLALAKDIAEDWYLTLIGKQKRGELRYDKPFKEAAEQFIREYEVITHGQRNQKYVEMQEMRLRVHVIPFFGQMGLSEVTAGKVQEYRIHRHEQAMEKYGQPPARSTLHQEIVALRQSLKTAVRHGWLDRLPDLSEPYKASSKITHRAWFSPEEYKKLYEATRRRAKKPTRERYAWESEQLHDYVLFMANTGLRPDEAKRLEYRDVEIAEDWDTGEVILEIEVRGKRGIGFCKSTKGAVEPFKRLKERNKPQPNDRLFPKTHRDLLNTILEEEGLKFDREGQRRTAYSLRHTYICLRLMEGADIYQIAKNCRTSVEMIEKYYASHIKNRLDAAAINVRRKKRRPKSQVKKTGRSRSTKQNQDSANA